MAELVTSQGYQLVPDVAGSLAGGYQTGMQLRGAYDENQRQSQFRQLAGVIQDPRATPEQKMQAQQQLSAIDPERTQKLQQSITQNLSSEELREVTSIARGYAQINAIPTPEGKLQAAKDRLQKLVMEGRGDLSDTRQLIAALEAGQTDVAQQMIDKGIQAGQLIGVLETGKGLGGAGGASEVQSAKILEDGTVQIVRKDGTVEIKAPTEADAEIVARAQDVGVDVQTKRAQGRGLGKDAAKQSSEAVDQVGQIRGNNETLKQVIDEVRGGAETGPLADRLPSFRAASVRLNQLKNKLGLDVVGSVTFGALSEGELKLALNTALPTNLDGPQLIKWAEDKIAAQEKLASYLEDQAIFLGEPGNTRSDWLSMKKQQAKTATEAQPPAAQPAPAGQPASQPKFLGFE